MCKTRHASLEDMPTHRGKKATIVTTVRRLSHTQEQLAFSGLGLKSSLTGRFALEGFVVVIDYIKDNGLLYI